MLILWQIIVKLHTYCNLYRRLAMGTSGFCAKTNSKTVPAVNCHNGEGQIDKFVLAEVRLYLCMNLAKPGTIQASFFPSKPKPGKNGHTLTLRDNLCKKANAKNGDELRSFVSTTGISDMLELSRKVRECPFFPVQLLDKGIVMCYDQYSTSQYPYRNTLEEG